MFVAALLLAHRLFTNKQTESLPTVNGAQIVQQQQTLTPELIRPLKLGDITLKNRCIMAPLTRGRCDEKTQAPDELNALYYQQRSCAGLIISEATVISKQATGWSRAPGIYTDEQVAGWKKVTDAVHSKGGLIFCQLWHMGRVTHSSFFGLQPIAPSALLLPGQTTVHGGQKVDRETPRAMTNDDIKALIAEYAHAAKCARLAGFDGIEIHAANGYLLDLFLQSHTNLRHDQYGGNPQNRFRLLAEVIEAILNIWPAERVGIRFSPNGIFQGMGAKDNFETFKYAIQQIEKFKLGYLHLMDGIFVGVHDLCPRVTLLDAKKLYNGVVIGNGSYTPLKAEGAIFSGAADAIAFGKPWITNPDLVVRLENNWPLAPNSTEFTSSADPKSRERGYTDFPVYKQ